jgi:hypothetical protein
MDTRLNHPFLSRLPLRIGWLPLRHLIPNLNRMDFDPTHTDFWFGRRDRSNRWTSDSNES